MAMLQSEITNLLCFEDKWPEMRPVVLKILQQEPVTKDEWQDLFYLVHVVCMWDDHGHHSIKLSLKFDIIQYLRQIQQRIMVHQEDQALLRAYIAEWRKYFSQCDYLPTPFTPMENYLTKKPPRGQKIIKKDCIVRKLMLDCWNESIFRDLNNRLQDIAMKLVDYERNGESFDSQLVIRVRESYVNLCSNHEDRHQIYREYFERAYINTTELFYITRASEYLEVHGIHDYMKYADIKIQEEKVRAQKYLDTSSGSVQKLTERCVSVLVSNFSRTIVAECTDMIKCNDTKKLTLMFKLLDQVKPNGIKKMLRHLEVYIVNAGIADMMASADIITRDSEKYVEQLLLLFHKFSELVKEAFNNDPRFLTSRDKAFKKIVNDTTVFQLELRTKQNYAVTSQPESKCPELLANYSDMLLRKTPLSKRLTADEIESKLKNVLLVLKYIQNKDVFMRFHKAHLTRRLILNTSADSEKEENMVEWLREVGMPAEYVNKLGRMFQDIKVSVDLNQQFKETFRHIKGSIADSINIKILNAAVWSRNSERITVSLPMELEDYIPKIEDFYRTKHSGRKLQWYHHMSNGTITFLNEVGRFDLEVTTFQMAVLFAWNQRPKDKISYENLRLATELTDPELRRTLWSLVAFPKLKRQVVQVSSEITSPKEFNENTTFWINEQFSIVKNGKWQKRGKVNLIGRLQLSTERSNEEDNECIVQLRILRVQEAIIKILKMRKKISSCDLQTELVDILKNMFLPSKKLIKEQIEWLIEQKYMKREKGSINMFVYII